MKTRLPLMLLGGLYLGFIGLPATALSFAPETKHNRASLRGLEGIYISLEKVDPQAQKDGLTEALIRKDVVGRLSRAGIPILSKEQWLASKGSPYLYVNVNVLKLKETKEYIYAIYVALKQDVYPVRRPVLVLGATTWSTGATMGITYRLEKIRSSLMDRVEKFVHAYLSENPK